MNKQVRLAVFISGSGTNLQSIIDRCADGTIPAEVALVVSSDPEAYGLVRAEKAGIERAVYRRKDFPDGKAADNYLLALLDRHRIDIIALAGYLKMVAPAIISRYRGRVVNIHPGLLPKYGGKGMYGYFVHEAVIAAGDKETGVTIHIVDEIYDHGEVLACEKVPVMADDTPDELAERVLKVEHFLYPQVLKELSEKIAKEKAS
jgi:formyltetrahydrofolate-dependent phosphoribosylglycinamide formyltransferase